MLGATPRHLSRAVQAQRDYDDEHDVQAETYRSGETAHASCRKDPHRKLPATMSSLRAASPPAAVVTTTSVMVLARGSALPSDDGQRTARGKRPESQQRERPVP